HGVVVVDAHRQRHAVGVAAGLHRGLGVRVLAVVVAVVLLDEVVAALAVAAAQRRRGISARLERAEAVGGGGNAGVVVVVDGGAGVRLEQTAVVRLHPPVKLVLLHHFADQLGPNRALGLN